MYNYQFKLKSKQVVEFESAIHISLAKMYILEYGTFIYFSDSEYAINLNTVKDVKINGIKHRVRPYAMR